MKRAETYFIGEGDRQGKGLKACNSLEGEARRVVVADHFVAALFILGPENDVTDLQWLTHMSESVSPQFDQTYATHNPNYWDKRRTHGSSQRLIGSLTNHCCHPKWVEDPCLGKSGQTPQNV